MCNRSYKLYYKLIKETQKIQNLFTNKNIKWDIMNMVEKITKFTIAVKYIQTI